MLLGSTIASLTFVATGRNYVATFAAASIFPAIALVWMIQACVVMCACEQFR
jgi:hypothetical protein